MGWSAPRWQHVLQKAWSTRGPLARLLWPLSQIYGELVRRHRLAFESGHRNITRLAVPVVVVGNVVAGGAGKTPLVIALVRHCLQAGWRVGVVSRGYGRRETHSDAIIAVGTHSLAEEVGDEPLLIARTTGVPVYVGRDRVAAAQALIAKHPDLHLIICDDGLQHLALGRDLELCVFDERETGNGWLLPAGPLREPWPRVSVHGAPCLEIQSAGAATRNRIRIQRTLADYAYRADGTRRSLWQWQGQSVRALAGIAKPDQFFQALQAQGLNLHQCMALPDHHAMDDVKLEDGSRHGVMEDVLCTEKDAVKLWPRYPHVWAVPLEVTLPRELQDRLDALVMDALKRPRRDGA